MRITTTETTAVGQQLAPGVWALRVYPPGAVFDPDLHCGDPYEWCGLLLETPGEHPEVSLTMFAPTLLQRAALGRFVASLGYTHWRRKRGDGTYTTRPCYHHHHHRKDRRDCEFPLPESSGEGAAPDRDVQDASSASATS